MATPASTDQISAALRAAAAAAGQADPLAQIQAAADAFALCLTSDSDRAAVKAAAATEIALRVAAGPYTTGDQ